MELFFSFYTGDRAKNGEFFILHCTYCNSLEDDTFVTTSVGESRDGMSGMAVENKRSEEGKSMMSADSRGIPKSLDTSTWKT